MIVDFCQEVEIQCFYSRFLPHKWRIRAYLDEQLRVLKLQKQSKKDSSWTAWLLRIKTLYSFEISEATHSVTSQNTEIRAYTAVITSKPTHQFLLSEGTVCWTQCLNLQMHISKMCLICYQIGLDKFINAVL